MHTKQNKTKLQNKKPTLNIILNVKCFHHHMYFTTFCTQSDSSFWIVLQNDKENH